MKVLLIDIGNSCIKWALSEDDQLTLRGRLTYQATQLETDLTQSWEPLGPLDAIYLSNVGAESVALEVSLFCQLKWQCKPQEATVQKQAAGVINGYKNPTSLGVDRWLALIAARSLYPQTLCVIDCGSATTLDVINAEGQHLGGLIFPGLGLLRRSLNEHTHALTASDNLTIAETLLLADNTQEAIEVGCQSQFIAGIERLMKKIDRQFKGEIEYIICGGDAEKVIKSLDRKLHHEADLVLKGLLISMSY